jgi:hypothetical protein
MTQSAPSDSELHINPLSHLSFLNPNNPAVKDCVRSFNGRPPGAISQKEAKSCLVRDKPVSTVTTYAERLSSKSHADALNGRGLQTRGEAEDRNHCFGAQEDGRGSPSAEKTVPHLSATGVGSRLSQDSGLATVMGLSRPKLFLLFPTLSFIL